MTFISKFVLPAAIAACFGLSACSNPSPVVSQTPDSNPASGNLAPADPSLNAQAGTAQSQPANYAPTPVGSASAPYSANDSSGYATSDSADYYDDDSSQADAIAAAEPPPPLPDYSQPPCPGDNYIWNPGYWDYASAGYYWVPGAWVLAPYTGALWTPPWWGFTAGHYRFHGGYWGPHIGFYGGVNYGFGYTGNGFYGGYWNNGSYAYNRDVTNINTTVVHNVYNYNVTNVTANRVSYNGGPSGLRSRPTPQEMAVIHDQRMAPVAAQVAHAHEFQANRAQFASVNHGRPADVVAQRPLETTYKAPAARINEVPDHPSIIQARPAASAPRAPEVRAQNQPNSSRPEAPGNRPGAPGLRPEAPRPEPARPEAPAARNEAARPEFQRPAQPAARPQPQPAPQQAREVARPVERPQPQAAPAPRPEPVQRTNEIERPQAPRPAARQPEIRPEQRTAPAARPEARPEARPAPAPRPAPEARPAAPQPRPEARPAAAQPHPAPPPQKKEERK